MKIFISLLLSLSLVAANPLILLSGSQPAAVSAFLVEEGFEDSGAPSGWVQSSPGTAANYDDTSSPLTGAQSLLITDPGGSGTATVATPEWAAGFNDIYVAWKMNPSALIATAGSIFDIYGQPGGVLCGFVSWRTTDSKFTVQAAGGTASTTTAETMGAGQTRWLKVHFTKGTGTNAIIRLYVSTNGTSWGSLVQSTNGTATATATIGVFQINFNRNFNGKYDSVRVSTTDIAVSDVP